MDASEERYRSNQETCHLAAPNTLPRHTTSYWLMSNLQENVSGITKSIQFNRIGGSQSSYNGNLFNNREKEVILPVFERNAGITQTYVVEGERLGQGGIQLFLLQRKEQENTLSRRAWWPFQKKKKRGLLSFKTILQDTEYS